MHVVAGEHVEAVAPAIVAHHLDVVDAYRIAGTHGTLGGEETLHLHVARVADLYAGLAVRIDHAASVHFDVACVLHHDHAVQHCAAGHVDLAAALRLQRVDLVVTGTEIAVLLILQEFLDVLGCRGVDGVGEQLQVVEAVAIDLDRQQTWTVDAEGQGVALDRRSDLVAQWTHGG